MDTTLETQIIDIVSRESCVGNVTPETTIDSLNLDSLDFVSLMQVISAEVRDVPQDAWPDLNTVGDIVRAIEGAR